LVVAVAVDFGLKYATVPSYSIAPPMVPDESKPPLVNVKGASVVVPATSVMFPVIDPPPSETVLIHVLVAAVLVFVMFADVMLVAAAATEIVAKLIEFAGIAGAVGEAAAVPAITVNTTLFVDPLYAASLTVITTRSMRGFVASAVETFTMVVALL
jgi:hypothetical protein